MNTLSELEMAGTRPQAQSYRYPVIAPIEIPSAREAAHVERELRMQRAQAAAIESAHQQGLREGESKAREMADESISRDRAAVSRALTEFAGARRDYFKKVEADAVKLALAIAKRILRRESQVDSLLLAGVVRVALDQIQAGSRVSLKVNPTRVEEWRRWIADSPEIAAQCQVIGDDKLESEAIVLEASSGTAEISLEGQLKEIENGFLDMLERNTGAAV